MSPAQTTTLASTKQGYAMVDQVAAGIATRLYARAFIIASAADPSSAIVFVNMDACMATQGVTQAVLTRLAATYGPNTYTAENVALSGTHTHSGPGGYHTYVLYQITSLGFVRESFDALVDGVVEVWGWGTMAHNHAPLYIQLHTTHNQAPHTIMHHRQSTRHMHPCVDMISTLQMAHWSMRQSIAPPVHIKPTLKRNGTCMATMIQTRK